MRDIAAVKAWAAERLTKHRAALEVQATPELRTTELRARIAELKQLLAALDGKEPPVWIAAAE